MNITNINSTNLYGDIKKTANIKTTQSNIFNGLLANETDKYVSEKYNLVKENDFGTKVYDLSKIEGSLQNTLLSNDVKMFHQDCTGNTIFRAIFKKPNSNEPMTVNIIVPNCKFENGIDEKTFNDTFGKAILLMDKAISIYERLGD